MDLLLFRFIKTNEQCKGTPLNIVSQSFGMKCVLIHLMSPFQIECCERWEQCLLETVGIFTHQNSSLMFFFILGPVFCQIHTC